MNLKEIKDLIELVSEKGFAEFEIERQGFRLRLSRFQEQQQQVIPQATAPIIISHGIPGASEILSSNTQRALAPANDLSEAGSDQSRSDVDRSAPEIELQVIKSPIVGTFYRASSPNSEPFVKIGDRVEPDSVVCIIEAMKLMNEIQSEVSGEITRIFVENGQPVEYGQALFGIKV